MPCGQAAIHLRLVDGGIVGQDTADDVPEHDLLLALSSRDGDQAIALDECANDLRAVRGVRDARVLGHAPHRTMPRWP
jgi:hypothetical protein